MWIHLARTAQATTSLLTALGSWQVLYCRRGKPGEADFLDNDLSRDILITHRHISRVLNTVRDALPAPSTAVRYEERERERERSHIVTFLYNVCTVFLGTLLDTGILGSVWVTPLGTERSGENAHNLNSRTTQTATRAHLASRDLGEEGTRAVTMRRKGGRAVGQARAAAVAQLFPSQDSRPLELRALPLLSRLGQPHQRQHPLPSQAPLDPPISLLHLWLFPSSPAPVQLRICDPAEKIVAGRKAEVGKRPTPAWHTQGNRVLLKTQAKNLAVPSWSPFSRMQTRDTGSLLLEVSLTWPWQLRAARKNSLFLWFQWKPRGGGRGKRAQSSKKKWTETACSWVHSKSSLEGPRKGTHRLPIQSGPPRVLCRVCEGSRAQAQSADLRSLETAEMGSGSRDSVQAREKALLKGQWWGKKS